VEPKRSGVLASKSGQKLAKIVETDRKIDISIDRKEAPEFASFVLEHLQALFEEHRSKQ
jgi:ParB family chromosome partitioning protein